MKKKIISQASRSFAAQERREPGYLGDLKEKGIQSLGRAFARAIAPWLIKELGLNRKEKP